MAPKHGPTDFLEWDCEAIADVLKVSVDDVREYFTDGRRISFLLERRIAREVLKGKLAPSEGDHYDLTDTKGGKWEVRSISRQGIYFCPSYMVGSSRSFELKGFMKKLKELEGYIVCDIESFPKVPFWIIMAAEVRTWWKAGHLGKSTKISRKKALDLLK